MPAAVRGAGRNAAKARSKSSESPPKSRPRAAKPGPAVGRGLPISPRLALSFTALALGGAVVIALATGHRGERLVQSIQAAFEAQSAKAGLAVKTVRLVGASSQSSREILAAAGLAKGQPMLGLDLAAVRGRVEQVGWVKEARVTRLLPDTVVVAVNERRLVAVWEHAGHAVVIDKDGVAAPEADPARFASLPLVVGEGANVAAGAILPLVVSRPRLAERLEALVRVDDRRWDIRLRDGAIVQLPASDEETALIKLDQLDQQSRILDLGFSRIDLRDPEMVAVRPRQADAKLEADGAG
jgi:cell division protein FtsQ